MKRLLLALPIFFSAILHGQSTVPAQSPSGAAVTPGQSTVPAQAPSGAAVAPRGPMVTLLLSASDSRGNPVLDLSKDQFAVIDNGQSNPVLAVRRVADAPLDLGIVLYASKSFFPQEQAAAAALVKQVLRPNIDGAFVVTAGGSKPWPSPNLEWSDADKVLKTIQSLDKDSGIKDAFNFEISDNSGAQSRLWKAAVQRNDGPTVFDAIWAMMKGNSRPSRRAIVIFREPWANSPGGDKESTQYVAAKFAEIIRTAQQLQIPIYSIGIEDQSLIPSQDKNFGNVYQPTFPGAGASLRSFDDATQKYRYSLYQGGKANIEQLSSATGGGAYWDVKKNFPDAVAAIAHSLEGQYIFSFPSSPEGPASPAHSIKLVMNRGGLQLAAPGVYFVGQKQ